MGFISCSWINIDSGDLSRFDWTVKWSDSYTENIALCASNGLTQVEGELRRRGVGLIQRSDLHPLMDTLNFPIKTHRVN